MRERDSADAGVGGRMCVHRCRAAVARARAADAADDCVPGETKTIDTADVYLPIGQSNIAERMDSRQIT